MQINFQQLRTIMKKSGIPVYRDNAPTTAKYPYIVYEFVNEQHKRASNKVLKSMPLYQVAVITKGKWMEKLHMKFILVKTDGLILDKVHLWKKNILILNKIKTGSVNCNGVGFFSFTSLGKYFLIIIFQLI